MAPKLTLLYFDSAFWRAECCRLALHIGSVPFEDKRFTERDEFTKMKVISLHGTAYYAITSCRFRSR